MNIFHEIAQTLSSLHYQYTEQFFAALPLVILTVVLHGFGMRLAGLCYRGFGPSHSRNARHGPHVVLLASIVCIMLATHYLEVVMWAIFYLEAGILAEFKNAMFYSINAYTTLGASNITMTGKWQGIDGIEAITAMLMFGWSTAVLAAIVVESHSVNE